MMTIRASAIFRLASGDVSAGPTGVATIVDYGLMKKAFGTGTITVGARVDDRGVVEAATGTLDLTSRLIGTGALKIDSGATLEADGGAISTLTTNFNGAMATLALKLPDKFDAVLSGFSAGDVIDLLAIKATGASVNDSDQLVVVNGDKTVATLQLRGNYVAATLSATPDGDGGTNIELTAPQADLPCVQKMAAAMASMARPAGEAVVEYGFRTRPATFLAKPHVMLS